MMQTSSSAAQQSVAQLPLYNKKSINDILGDIRGKRVLIRVDFNVPIGKDGKVEDDTRMREALPTIELVLKQGGSVVLMSHLGRPEGTGFEAQYSLKPVAEHLARLMKREVKFATDCRGEAARSVASALKPGEVLLLENTRFYKEEEGKIDLPKDAPEVERKAQKAAMVERQKAMAKDLADLGEGIYVNDAFGTAHRKHASTATITQFSALSVSGLLMEKEIRCLGQVLANPERPFVAILGGSKVSDKVGVISNLLTKVDTLIIGGAMAYTFYKAQGIPVGASKVEGDDVVEVAKGLLAEAKRNGVKLLLPIDHRVARELSETAEVNIVGEREIAEGWKGLDIGPRTENSYIAEVARARTVVWNGPLGCFEFAPFSNGTFSIAKAIASTDCMSVIGGGDSISALNQAGVADKVTHASTGGGASLEFLEGKALPGIVALNDR